MRKIINAHPVIAILRNTPDELLLPYVAALFEGGIKSFEISFTTPDAARQIEMVKEHLPDEVLVGAGTILTPAEADESMKAGADYLLSPAADTAVLKHCQKLSVPFMPGVYSPSDVSTCLAFGFHTLKLFPADALPDNYIKSLKGPFPQAEFVAVGGVTSGNAAAYFKNGFIGVGIGSSLAAKDALAAKNWNRITTDITCLFESIRKGAANED